MSRLSGYGLPIPPNPAGDLPAFRRSRLQVIQRLAAAKQMRPGQPVPLQGKPPMPPQRAMEEQQRRQQPIRRFQPPGEETPKEYRTAPVPGGKAWTNDPREIMGLISEYAKRKMVVIIRYRKQAENGRVISRAVEPYSIRIRRRRRDGQIVRYFYGYDVNGPTVAIHSFIIGNLVSVQGTNQIYRPRWMVEF